MANPRRASTIQQSVATMESSRGPQIEHFNTPIDKPALYKWVPGSLAVQDGVAVLTHQGGTSGKWLRLREDVQGADLVDGGETIQVGGDYWRNLPLSTLTGNSVLVLGTTNAVAGDELTVTRLDVEAFTYQVDNGGAGAGTLITFPVSVRYFADFYFDGTNWLLKRAGQMAT